MLKSFIFELHNRNLHQKKTHINCHLFHYWQKMCDIVVALRKPENALHARTSQNRSQTHITNCDRTSQLAEVRPHITSHALSKIIFANNLSSFIMLRTIPRQQLKNSKNFLYIYFHKNNQESKICFVIYITRRADLEINVWIRAYNSFTGRVMSLYRIA